MGIDIGKHGGFGVIGRGFVVYGDLFSEDFERFIKRCVIGVEKINAVKGQGLVSSFHFGIEYGKILGVLQYEKIVYKLIHPLEWTRFISMPSGLQKKEKKEYTVKKIEKDLRLCGLKSGYADAIAIAMYLKGLCEGKSYEEVLRDIYGT